LEYSCNQFYSHLNPKILLKDHLAEVGRLCRKYAERADVSKEIVECAELIGKCHDLGKYTKYFQEHLRGMKVPRSLYSHSRLSAILGSWSIYKRLEDDLLSLIAFLCISCHHGRLKNLSKLRDDLEFLDAPNIRKQIDSIKENLDVISDELEELELSEICELIEGFNDNIYRLKDILRNASTRLELDMKLEFDESQIWRYYYTILLLFSCLIDADKRDAGRISEIDFSWRGDLVADAVIRYIESNLRNENDFEINKIRNEIFTLVSKQLDGIFKQGRVPKMMTITAPTGSGKTLLSLYVALRLREKMRNKRPRIIYCLPYINIIEQTYGVFKDVFQGFYGEAPLELLLKHHHLFFPTASSSSLELSLDKMLLLTDSWESEVIVTTFEQLFRTIIGSRNASLKKLHNIANSILILDEVQAIPLEYWKLVRDALENLANHLNVTIIMMTATMPTLLRSGQELVPNHLSFFRRLNRTILIPHIDEPINADKFVDFFFSRWRRDRSALIVLNTIRTSKRVYHKIAKRLGDKAYRIGKDKEPKPARGKIVLAYLSTSVIPKVRKERIQILKHLLSEGYPVILVSTQAVEAGVDLDFDMAFRDLGPLDSIIQVAGRCNRNWRGNTGEVFILRIVGDRGWEDSRKIYGTILPGISLEILKNVKEVCEKDVPALVKKYYEEAIYRAGAESSEESEEVLENVKSLKYEELDFSLIKEEPKIPVYIEYDDDAEMLLRNLQETVKALGEAENLEEVFRHKANLKRIRAEMENYVAKAYKNDSRLASLNPVMERLDVRYVPRNVLKAYYDEETGFISDWEAVGKEAIII